MKIRMSKSMSLRKSKKDRALRKNWKAAKARMDAMTIGPNKLALYEPRPAKAPKALVSGILAVLELNSDRLASNGVGISYNESMKAAA